MTVVEEKRKILSWLEGLKHKEDVIRVLQQKSLEHSILDFVGDCRGVTEGVPIRSGTCTTAEGRVSVFPRSTREVGDVVEYDGQKQLVVFHWYRSVDCEDDYLVFIMVSLSNFT